MSWPPGSIRGAWGDASREAVEGDANDPAASAASYCKMSLMPLTPYATRRTRISTCRPAAAAMLTHTCMQGPAL